MFCNQCGISSGENDKFCSNFGRKLINSKKNHTKINVKFTSRVLGGENILTPDKLILDDYGVTYEKLNNNLIGVDKTFLSYNNIAYLNINRKLLCYDINISSKSSDGITAKKFSISDAAKIESLKKSRL